jgi:carbonic anhydrase
VHTDISCLSVIQFAVEILRIEHVIVCGHYNCGGVHAACDTRQLGLIDNWLRHIKDIYVRHREELDGIVVVQNAWALGQPLSVHGLIYDVTDGLLRDLAVRIANPAAGRHLSDEYGSRVRLATQD